MKITVNEAKKRLLAGEVVAIPTETVYGLAAWLLEEQAINAIFRLKGRPAHNPLILHVANKEACYKFLSAIPNGFSALADAFWPGPLTLVLPIKEETIPAVARASLPTAAFRVPSHPLTLQILQEVQPLVAPSANISGLPSGTNPEHVEHDFGQNFPVVDGGAAQHGVESTILLQSNGVWQIARLGAISQEALAKVLGYVPEIIQKSDGQIVCPGQLLQHYAPMARLHLAENPQQKRCVVGFAERHYEGAKKVYILGKLHAPEEVSHRLYDTLRQLDQDNISEAWVDMLFPTDGLWKTIRERLSRAASR